MLTHSSLLICQSKRVAYLVTRFSPYIKGIQNVEVFSCGDQCIAEVDLILPVVSFIFFTWHVRRLTSDDFLVGCMVRTLRYPEPIILGKVCNMLLKGTVDVSLSRLYLHFER